MPLRIDLMQDPEFRKDIMALIGAMLRDLGEKTVRAVVMEEGWLEKRVDAYILRNPLDGVVWEKVVAAMRTAPGPIIQAVKDAVLPALRDTLLRLVDEKFREFEKRAQVWVERQVDESVRLLLGRALTTKTP